MNSTSIRKPHVDTTQLNGVETVHIWDQWHPRQGTRVKRRDQNKCVRMDDGTTTLYHPAKN